MSKILRDISLRDFGASLNTVESYTNESSQGKIGLCETANKQKCTHLGMFLASEETVFYEYEEAKLTKAEYQEYLKELEIIDIQQQRADIDYIMLMMGIKED